MLVFSTHNGRLLHIRTSTTTYGYYETWRICCQGGLQYFRDDCGRQFRLEVIFGIGLRSALCSAATYLLKLAQLSLYMGRLDCKSGQQHNIPVDSETQYLQVWANVGCQVLRASERAIWLWLLRFVWDRWTTSHRNKQGRSPDSANSCYPCWCLIPHPEIWQHAKTFWCCNDLV